MLGGVVFGHEQGNVAIAAINELVRDAGKPMWDWQAPAKDDAFIAQVGALAEQKLRDAYQIRSQAGAHAGHARRDRRDPGRAVRRRRRGRQGQGRQHPVRHRSQDRPQPDPLGRAAHRRPRHAHRAADRDPHRPPAARPRLGALHARRDPGAGRGDARHRPRLAAHRRARRRVQRALHAPLQHAAVRDRRDRPRRLAEAARDRPRPPRQARARRRAARSHRVPVLDARRLRDHRVERLVVDGLGLRRLPGADGRRRAAQGARRRHRHGPDQGRQPLRGADRHPRRRGSPRRHGLQGRRHDAPA